MSLASCCFTKRAAKSRPREQLWRNLDAAVKKRRQPVPGTVEKCIYAHRVADTHLSRVTITPGVRSGQPIIRGTRTTVADILGWLAAGAPESEILSDYPWLQSEDIKGSLAYAAREIRML